MTSLEEGIKELERKLAIKKAFLAVQFKFAGKVDPEISELVMSKLRELANELAESEEATVKSRSNALTSEEVAILKLLAETVTKKKSAPAVNAPIKAVESTPQKKAVMEEVESEPLSADHQAMIGKMATITTLDGVMDVNMRAKLDPRPTVRIKSITGEYAYVQDLRGNMFNVDINELELKSRRKE